MNQEILGLREQIRQLNERHAAGAVAEAEYADRKALLERQLLDAVIKAPETKDAPQSSMSTLAVAAGVIVLFAVAAYMWLGSPGGTAGTTSPATGSAVAPQAATSPASPADAAHSLAPEQIGSMTDRLRARLKEQPGDAEGWAMLGRTYAVTGRHAEAVDAFRQAATLRKDDPVLLADYADAMAGSNNGNLDGEPIRMIERALELAPDNLKALSMAGAAAFARNDAAKALAYWDKLVRLAPPDSPFVKQLQGSIEQARKQTTGQALPSSVFASVPKTGTASLPK
jgi:cytochrome c-type biogenesis protein CcmH